MSVNIEAAIIYHLRADSNVTQYVSSFNGSPAIFTDVAPQEATEVYIVLDIQGNASDNLAIDSFLVDIDIYGLKDDTVNIRALTLAIEFALDREILECDEYTTIRFYRESKGHVDNRDIKIIHYNMQMSARGSRYAWMQQIVR